MENAAKLLTAIALLAWPLVFGALLFCFYKPIRTLVESALQRKFTIKVAGNELTMEEASEQQRAILSDLQVKISELEKRFVEVPNPMPQLPTPASPKRILWVDDNPKNNSYFVASLEERGVRVDTALSTEEGLAKFRRLSYDLVISDMGRPEGDRAGIELAKRIRSLNRKMPIYIFCGTWAARNLRDEALAAGVTEISSSGTTLLTALHLDES
jgi:CheY-like chemotaxis protein